MANEGKYTPGGSAPDGKIKEGDDLKASAKKTLGSYLSSLTKAADTKNAFPIEKTPNVETSLKGSSGLPSEFKTGGEDPSAGFTNTFPNGGSSNSAVSNFETLSNSDKIEKLSDVLDKNARKDGHNLLRDIASNREPGEPGVGDASGASAIKSPAGETQVQKKISSMLATGNRFDPTPGSSPYIEDGQFTEPGIPITQTGFGIYDDAAVRTSLEELHKVAHSLMVRATGHAVGNTDPDSVSAISTTDVQIGSELADSEKLMARNAFAAPEKLGLQNAELRYDDITGDALTSQKSFGALSSYREPFGDAAIANLNTAVQSLGQYLIGAVVFTAVLSLIELLEAEEHTPSAKDPKSLKKGARNNEGPVLRFARQIGVPRLSRPTWKCAIYGFAAWLKIPPALLPDATEDPPSIPGSPPLPLPDVGGMAAVGAWFATLAASADDVFFNALYGSGYYANVMRVVRRDLDRMLSEISFAVDSDTSAGDGAKAMFDLFMNLNSYTSWNFFVSILRMGDAWLNSYDKQVRFNKIHVSGQTRQQLSRQPKTNLQAWRHRSSPALVLLSEKYVNASSAFGFSKTFIQNLHNDIGDPASRTNGTPYYDNLRPAGKSRGLKGNGPVNVIRYSNEDRIAIENELDAEYCPFYFHDLRTNEIISFHAFLSDLKDSYSVSYAESGGYGRIDKVKIYQDTTRSISLSWTMVATSPKDFDSMWWSLNKLVSMLYPSFSMGKPVKAGNKKFIMPFSQIPTASPLIRLRVGDVVRSNYSRFNLARLFGLSEIKPASASGTGGAELDTGPFNISEPSEASVKAAKEKDDKAAKEAAADAAAQLAARFGDEPSSSADDKFGFLPGDESWGKAILRPSSAGYVTFDTGPGKVIKIKDTGTTSKNTVTSNPAGAGSTHVTSKPFTSRPTTSGLVKILERIVFDPETGVAVETGDADSSAGVMAIYYVQYEDRDDPADPYGPVSKKGHFHTYAVFAEDLEPISPPVAKKSATDPAITEDTQIADVNSFFDPKNNAIVRSFEAAGGRGLAGVITSLDFDWGEAQWDMSGLGRRAPTLLNISIAFSPIHDIVPGLDNNGMMRAMNYPVGEIAGPLGTDFHDPGGVRNGTYAAKSDSPGVKDVSDASLKNYKGFEGSIDKDGESGRSGESGE